MKRTALITGITGQDGSYLAEFLLEKDYDVVGLTRRSSTDNLQNILHIKNKITLAYGDLTDQSCIDRLIMNYAPDEIYNLGAMSFVPVSWEAPDYTMEVNAIGPIRILEAMRNYCGDSKFYSACSSEVFGKVREMPQNESTPFYPRSPYGVSKVASYWATVNYRESYNLFAVNGILFNHESIRRGEEFVTRKITSSVARIKKGLQNELGLGNLDSKRDWGSSKDYIRAMWLMLQQDKPDDYVIGMDETHSVRELCDLAFNRVGLNYKDYVVVDEKFYRPAEVDVLMSDSSKSRKILGWKPEYSFKDLIYEMVDYDMEVLK